MEAQLQQPGDYTGFLAASAAEKKEQVVYNLVRVYVDGRCFATQGMDVASCGDYERKEEN